MLNKKARDPLVTQGNLGLLKGQEVYHKRKM